MSKTDVSGNAQKGRKGLIVTVVAIVVIALAGAGFWVASAAELLQRDLSQADGPLRGNV